MLEVIVTQTLLFLTAILGIAMQYKYTDKRTIIFKRLRNIFVILTIVAFPISLFVSWKENREKQFQILSVSHNFDSLKHRLDTSIFSLNLARNQLKMLDSRSAKLDSQLTPFLQLAKKKYPRLPADSALNRLRVTIINNTYINNAPRKRALGDKADSIVEALRNLPKGAYQLYYLTSDVDSYELANEIEQMLDDANWQKLPPILLISKPGLKGITIYVSQEKEPLITFANSLSKALNAKAVGVALVSEDTLRQIGMEWNERDIIPKDIPTALIFIGPNVD